MISDDPKFALPFCGVVNVNAAGAKSPETALECIATAYARGDGAVLVETGQADTDGNRLVTVVIANPGKDLEVWTAQAVEQVHILAWSGQRCAGVSVDDSGKLALTGCFVTGPDPTPTP
jgi:hypothetical protein